MSNVDRIVLPVNLSAGPLTDTAIHVSGPLSIDDQRFIQATLDDDLSESPSDVALACLTIVEERRQGHITLAHATLQLVELLPDDDTGNEAYGSYLDQLTEIDHKRALASSRGKTTNEAIVSRDVQRAPDQIPAQKPSGIATGVLKRTIDHPDGPSHDSSPDTSANESLYAWAGVPVATVPLDADVARTLTLQANYLVDVKRAKNNLVVRPDCPDFPDGLWTDILLDRYIDLDCIYAGHYALESDMRHTQSIGDVDITVNHAGLGPKSNKSIHTHGEWAIAFAATKQQFSSCTLTEPESSRNTRNLLWVNSLHSLTSPSTSGSSCSTAQFDFESPARTIYRSTATIDLATSSLTTLSSEPTHLLPNSPAPPPNDLSPTLSTQTLKSVTDGTAVAAPQTLANTNMPASSVGRNTK